MNIQELEDKHKKVIGESDLQYPDYFDDYTPLELESRYKKEEELVSKEATKLSIEFAISVLESIDMSLHLNSEAIYSKRQQKFIEDKIQELKQYLNE